MNKDAQIDVIIPVYQPDRSFEKLLQRLMQQEVPVHHIYLLQTIEKEGDGLIQTKDERISVHAIQKKDFDHGRTRDYGASLVQDELREGVDPSQCFLLYMTQDALPADRKLTAKLLKAFEDGQTGISYARQLVHRDGDLLEKLTRLHNYPAKSMVKTRADIGQLGIQTFFCSDVCAMYRLNIYQEMGGFVSPTIFNEDMIMAYYVIHAGYQVVYQAEAKVYHSHSYTCMQQFHRNFDLGVSQRQYHQIFETISSEKEGAGYAKEVLVFLIKRGRLAKAFYFALQCGFKLVGYRLGKKYDKLPAKFVKACTMSPGYVGFKR